ncbi:MAG: TIGR04372 family glycosyltransferase [Actinobacteria bacterium]|nr:TIGR04372 family glycosyltransferase [Actinomycetota bacterium]
MLKYFRGRSLGYIIKFVSVLPLALLLWIVIELVNLFRPVFIVGLSYKGRITHYMWPMELHLRNANQLNKKYTMIFVMPAATPNEAVRTVYRRYSIIIDSHYPKFIRRTFSILAELLKFRYNPKLPTNNLLWKLAPATKLSIGEIEFGKNLRRKLGIPEASKYVCLSVKDGAYYSTITPDNGYGQDLRSQAEDSRNVNIDDYMGAATYLAMKGIYVVRMGSVVSGPLPKNRHARIIDYAFEFRSELGDIVLYRNCLFELNGTAGSIIFAASSNRPIAQCDEYEIDSMSQSNHPPRAILALSLIKESKSGRLLSIREIVKLGILGQHDDILRRFGLERRNNSAAEILEAVIELEDLISNKFTLSAENKLLQIKFYQCYEPPLDPIDQSLVIISPSFLRKYEHLL